MQSILITGADGFIGRHLIARLLKEDVRIYALVRCSSMIYDSYESDKLFVYKVDLMGQIDLDITDDIDVMFHLAWAGVTPEKRNNMDVQISNIYISANCIKLAERLKVRKIIFPGSTNEYLYYGKPLDKDAVPSPSNMYGVIKITARYVCELLAKKANIAYIYTIISSIYAADRKDNNVIYYTIDKLLNNEYPSLTKLEQKWDYIYVDDVIEALLAVGSKGVAGKVYAIGHGDNWPLSKYIQIIRKEIAPNVKMGIGDIPYESNIIPSSCVNIEDLVNDTGFVPTVSFNEGIVKVINTLKKERGRKSEKISCGR